MRTFMCTVGTYGLRGWNTSDTPIASNGAPASSGRCCVADGGSAWPFTCEKLQPPRSSSLPSSSRRVSPSPSSLPPGSRVQPSLIERLAVLGLQRGDDALLQAEQVRANGVGGHGSHSRRWGVHLMLDRAVADVAPVLRAVEVDARAAVS